MTQEQTVERTTESTGDAENSVEHTATGADTSQPDPEVLIGEAPAADSATKGEEEVPVNAADAVAETAEEPSEAQVIEELRAQLAAAEQKNAELVDNLQRTAAEFQNSRRRQEKQLSDAIERAGGHVVERLLPVMDDLTLAFSNLPEELDETTNAWVDGFRQIRKKLEGMLSDQGVTTIPLDGEFDPNRHEAISSEPSESVESGHIIETLRVGYEYKGRVLRPALVRVAM